MIYSFTAVFNWALESKQNCPVGFGLVGALEGLTVGIPVGAWLGLTVGMPVGALTGDVDGLIEGDCAQYECWGVSTRRRGAVQV